MAMFVIPQIPATAKGLAAEVAGLSNDHPWWVNHPIAALRRITGADGPDLAQSMKAQLVVGLPRDLVNGPWAVVNRDDRPEPTVTIQPEALAKPEYIITTGFANAAAAVNAAIYIGLRLHWPVDLAPAVDKS